KKRHFEDVSIPSLLHFARIVVRCLFTVIHIVTLMQPWERGNIFACMILYFPQKKNTVFIPLQLNINKDC
ncbi:MAG: hypothetical protein AAF959_27365, partial [Cyanobacteria bacterium P01_D01_bin.56]